MALYPSTTKPVKPHLTADGTTQVMSMDEGSPVRTLTIYQACRENVFDVDMCNNTSDRGPKPIEELIKLQFEPKLEQCSQLNRDLTSHEHRCIADVPHKNADLFFGNNLTCRESTPTLSTTSSSSVSKQNQYHKRK